MPQDVQFDWDLIRRYDTRGPRYTSYPTALRFNERFAASDYEDQARHSNNGALRPLSAYIHIPFCEHLCFYCACNKIATRNKSLAADYLEYLLREIDLRCRLFGSERRIEQLHFGDVINRLMCFGELELSDIGRRHGIDAAAYFGASSTGSASWSRMGCCGWSRTA